MMAKVQWVDEEPVQPHERNEFEAAARVARRLLTSLIAGERKFSDPASDLQTLLTQAGDIPDYDLEFSFWLSRFLPISPEARQKLLETTSTLDRFKLLIAHFDESTTTVSHPTLPSMAIDEEEEEDYPMVKKESPPLIAQRDITSSSPSLKRSISPPPLSQQPRSMSPPRAQQPPLTQHHFSTSPSTSHLQGSPALSHQTCGTSPALSHQSCGLAPQPVQPRSPYPPAQSNPWQWL